MYSCLPGDVIDAAVEQCQKTMVTHVDVSPESIKKLVDAFATFGVTKAQIEKRIQRRIDVITPAQVVRMREIYASLNDGMSDPSDWFEPEEDKTDATSKKGAPNATAATERLKATLKGANSASEELIEPKKTNRQPKTETPQKDAKSVKNEKTDMSVDIGSSEQIIDGYRARIVNAKSQDELKKIMDELFKRDDILDAKRDELYHMIDDFAERIG